MAEIRKRGRPLGWRAPIKTKRVTISLSEDEIELLKAIDPKLSRSVRLLLILAPYLKTVTK